MKLMLKFCAFTLLVFVSCNNKKIEKKISESTKEVSVYSSFGDKISEENALTSAEMLTKFASLKAGDTINLKFASNIKEVCTKKGCWMKLSLTAEKETMVRFKDYGFFMPLDAKDSQVIVQGKAFVKETSVKELQHYAADAGKTKEEIAKITAPKKEFAFEANGVLMKVK
jgi:hypothetical protein